MQGLLVLGEGSIVILCSEDEEMGEEREGPAAADQHCSCSMSAESCNREYFAP